MALWTNSNGVELKDEGNCEQCANSAGSDDDDDVLVLAKIKDAHGREYWFCAACLAEAYTEVVEELKAKEKKR